MFVVAANKTAGGQVAWSINFFVAIFQDLTIGPLFKAAISLALIKFVQKTLAKDPKAPAGVILSYAIDENIKIIHVNFLCYVINLQGSSPFRSEKG
jgi:hypothetical protein